MIRSYHKWFTHRLGREMELLVFGHSGERVVVFPARLGRFYEYEDWRLVEALREPLEAGSLQLFCVDGIDGESLYCENCHPVERIARHKAYESYVLEEVLPFTQDLNDHPVLVAHGCSFGAFHAANIALRHPQHFRRLVALSGRYDLTRSIGSFRDLFDGHYDQDVYFHTPLHFVPLLEDQSILRQYRAMEIIFVVGREDPFYDSTRAMSKVLCEKGVSNHLAVWEGEAHRAHYWRQMVRQYLVPFEP